MAGTLRRQALPIAIVLVAAGAMTAFYAMNRPQPGSVRVDAGWALQRHAEENGVPVEKLLHELADEYPGARTWPVRGVHVSELPSGAAGVEEALRKLARESAWPWTRLLVFPLMAVLLTGALWTLATRSDFRRWRWAVLAVAVAVFGLWLGGSPGAMDTVVKAFKVLMRLEVGAVERALTLAAFTLLAIAGNKLICGWVCPLGALQDLLHRFSPLPKWRPPFWLTNSIRVALFGVFLCLLFGWVFGIERFVVYHYVNFFKIFTWTMAFPWWVLIPTGLLCLVWYRPYCHLICPFGLWSWVAEHVSVARVRVRTDACVRCQKCVKACPTRAADARINSGGRKVGLPDCYACGACVEVCPARAVVFDVPRADAVTSLPPRAPKTAE